MSTFLKKPMEQSDKQYMDSLGQTDVWKAQVLELLKQIEENTRKV